MRNNPHTPIYDTSKHFGEIPSLYVQPALGKKDQILVLFPNEELPLCIAGLLWVPVPRINLAWCFPAGSAALGLGLGLKSESIFSSSRLLLAGLSLPTLI